MQSILQMLIAKESSLMYFAIILFLTFCLGCYVGFQCLMIKKDLKPRKINKLPGTLNMYRGSFKFEEVAIKEVPGISFNKARMLLKHPNIVAYLDIRIETVSERSVVNLTMELFACSLEDHIDGAENSKRITIVEKDVLLQCFKGFSYIHSLDIVHGNISASKILLKEEYGVVVAKISDCYAISDSSKQTDILKLGEMFIQVASMSTKKSDRFAAMELYKLTSSMIPENRSDILTLIRHRYFWTYDRTLAFLISVSTRLERKNELTDIISANFAKSIGRRTNWVHELERMDKTIVETLSGYRFYNGKKPEDLLRAIRNIRYHYEALDDDTRKHFGSHGAFVPESFVEFWLVRFPYLVEFVYYSLDNTPMSSEKVFVEYFN